MQPQNAMLRTVASKRSVHKRFWLGWSHFWRQIFKVFRNPIFFALTVVGNATVLIAALLFFYVEKEGNPSVTSFGDALWWAFVTITSVGYGDTIPLTSTGRIIAVLLMLTGGVLFLSFIALLSSAFIELEFQELGQEIKELRKTIERLANK